MELFLENHGQYIKIFVIKLIYISPFYKKIAERKRSALVIPRIRFVREVREVCVWAPYVIMYVSYRKCMGTLWGHRGPNPHHNPQQSLG